MHALKVIQTNTHPTFCQTRKWWKQPHYTITPPARRDSVHPEPLQVWWVVNDQPAAQHTSTPPACPHSWGRRDPAAGGGDAGRPSWCCRGSWPTVLLLLTHLVPWWAGPPRGSGQHGASPWSRSLTAASVPLTAWRCPPWLLAKATNAATHPANTYAARQGTSTLQ